MKNTRIIEFGVCMFETTYIKSSYGLEGFVVVFLTVSFTIWVNGLFLIPQVSSLGWSAVKQAPNESHPDLCFQNLGSKQWLQPRRVKEADTGKFYLKGCVAESGICHILV